VTSLVAVFEAATWVKSMSMTKSLLKTREKGENMEVKDIFYINLHLIDGLGMEFTACLLSRADARGSADITYFICDAYRYFVHQAYLLTSKSRSRREYLIPTDNIIVLDHFFNLTKKRNLIGRV